MKVDMVERQKQIDDAAEQKRIQDEKMAWFQKKQMHVDLLTPSELERALEEKKEKQRLLLKEQRETELARARVDKEFFDDLMRDCLQGEPELRFAKFLVRASMKGLFTLNPMQSPQEKTRVITELLRFHGIALKESKTKPSLDDFQQTFLFVSDPFVHRGEVVTTRRSMFPESKPRQFQTESELR